MNQFDRCACEALPTASRRQRGALWLDLFLILLALNTFIVHYYLIATPAPCTGEADCVRYVHMFHAFRNHDFGPVEFPFNCRILAPFLAAFIPASNEVRAFQILNAISYNIFAIAFFLALRRLGVATGTSAALLAWFVCHPGGFPLYFSAPVSVDPLAYAISAIAVAVIAFRLLWILPVVGIAGVLEKESFLSVLVIICLCEIIALVADLWHRRKPALWPVVWATLAVIVAVAVQSVCVPWLFPPAQSYDVNALRTIRLFWNERLQYPFQFVVWLTAVFMATGIFPLLLGFVRAQGATDQRTWRMWLPLALISVAYVAFGLVAGSDMTRIVFNGLPFMLALIFYLAACGHIKPYSIAVVAALSLPILLGLQSGYYIFVEYAYYNGDPRYPMYWLAYVCAAILIGTVLVRRIERSADYSRAGSDWDSEGPARRESV